MGVLHSQTFGQHDKPGFAHGVGAVPRRGPLARARGDVDDGAVRGQQGQAGPDHAECPEEIDFHDCAPKVRVRFSQW